MRVAGIESSHHNDPVYPARQNHRLRYCWVPALADDGRRQRRCLRPRCRAGQLVQRPTRGAARAPFARRHYGGRHPQRRPLSHRCAGWLEPLAGGLLPWLRRAAGHLSPRRARHLPATAFSRPPLCHPAERLLPDRMGTAAGLPGDRIAAPLLLQEVRCASRNLRRRPLHGRRTGLHHARTQPQALRRRSRPLRFGRPYL